MRYFTVTGNLFYPGPKDYPFPERTTELGSLHWCFANQRINGVAADTQPRRDFATAGIDEQKIKEAIQHIPVKMDYYDWLRVCMAVHDVMPGNDGVALIESWSPGYSGEVAQKFRSFDRTAKDGGTIGTLFHMAKDHGWRPVGGPQKNGRMNHKQKMQALAAA